MIRDMMQVALVLCLVLSGADALGQSDATAWEKDLEQFAKAFFTAPHLAEVAAALDSLRGDALRSVFDGELSMLNAALPSVKTSSGIFMVLSVTRKDGMYRYEFSVSRAPHLAQACGRSLVGMACERFDLPAPRAIRISSRFVYHAGWTLTPEEHAASLAFEPPDLGDSIEHLGAMGLVRVSSSEIQYMQSDDGDEE